MFLLKPADNSKKDNTPVAIIGIGCLFPGSPGLKEFWHMLFHGKDAITDIPETHWSPEDYFDKDPATPDHVYCKRGGFLSPVAFDPSEFGIPPSSLEATDSSQILSLIAAKNALEDSGYNGSKTFDRDRTSVILGATGTQELSIPLGARLGHPKWKKALRDSGISSEKTAEIIGRISSSYVSWQENSFPGLLGNVIAGRICNRLDLGGTNCVIDAACASSLSAIHLAVMELTTGRSDMVITGGVDTLNDIFMHMCFSKTRILSPTGDVRPFSKDADGTVLGEGIGIIVLKRLQDAERDRDKIYAVIRGIGTSSDGKSQSIYAPRKEGQKKALSMAYGNSGIDPSTVEMVEAHGTGTRVGDMVEFQALKEVFTDAGVKPQNCAIGSVKSMIGHTKAAAGSAGLIKAALSLYHKTLLPTIKTETPDPNMGISDSPFYLNSSSRPWFSGKDSPRRCGVSSFGFGGSNFHAVLEEYENVKRKTAWDGSVEILAFSASSHSELFKQVSAFKSRIEKDHSAGTIAFESAGTRKAFSPADKFRILFVAQKIHNSPYRAFEELPSNILKGLEIMETNSGKTEWNSGNIFYGKNSSPGKIALIFPGQGSQYVGMGRDLVCIFPEAYEAIEKANGIFGSTLLTDYIYPIPVQIENGKKAREEALRKTEIAQPAIGSVSMAMLNVLNRFGIIPDAVCGHSFGELTALYAAGWIDPEALIHLSVSRGRYMASSSNGTGAMLAVSMPVSELERIINDTGVTLANINSPDQSVLSGPKDAIEKAEELCRKRGFPARILPVSAAFHTKQVKNALKPFMQTLKNISIIPTGIPVFSNTTGKPYPTNPESVKKLLCEQLLNPVNFAGEIENMYESGIRTFIETGPKSVLTGLVKSILKGREFIAVSADSSSGRFFGIFDLAKLICGIAAAGYGVNLNVWEDPPGNAENRRMSIPISGANYYKQTTEHREEKFGPETTDNNNIINPEISSYDPMSKNTVAFDNGNNPNFLEQALRVVQEGLKSMQNLQMQTAETHKKFLETQAESGRVLQKMMESTKHLFDSSLPGNNRSDIITKAEKCLTDVKKKADIDAASPVNIGSGEIQAENPAISKGRENNSSVRICPADNAACAEGLEIEKILLSTISRLTGYPEETLALDMDLEADLGIDSIKRVEIFSCLEENIPGITSIPPETMGTLKTLRKITEYLSGCSRNNEIQNVKSAESFLKDEVKETGSDKNIKNILISTISRLTGYPEETLALDMDLEADLGIDSIKRVEIFSCLEENIPGIASIPPETMGALKTLGKIIEYLEKSDAKSSISGFPDTCSESIPPVVKDVTDNLCKTVSVERNIVTITETPLKAAGEIRLRTGIFYITGKESGLSGAIAGELESLGIGTELLSIEEFINKKNLHGICGLLIIPDTDSNNDTFLKNAFLAAKHAANSLTSSGDKGKAVFAAISRLDGAFGFKGRGIRNPFHGGLAGLVKTASAEWEDVICRAIDIDPEWEESGKIAKAVVNELINAKTDGPVEIGLESGKRYITGLKPSLYPQGSINLSPGDVVIVTGGARGITAEAVSALSGIAQPTLVLFGRSPEPSPEPSWLTCLEDEILIKKAIHANDYSGNHASPKDIEKAFKSYMFNREIGRNLEKLRNKCRNVIYRSVDVRDFNAVSGIIGDIRSKFGDIKAIIHGAGVLEDRLIIDKTFEQFEKVFDTKVKGLISLLSATGNDPLRHIVIFSSVTARIGNKGQVDYAMANEVLNKVAQQEAVARPDCRVISINWGPWDGGMVAGTIKREFNKNKIELIPIEEGAKCMLLEMMGDKSNPVEVVIGSHSISGKEKKTEGMQNGTDRTIPDKHNLSFKREIDVESYPVLESHIIGGKPVVPFALMTEWLGHSALHESPGLFLCGLDDIRLLKGIQLDNGKKMIRLLAGKPVKKDSFFEVNVEIRDGVKDGVELIHTKAKAILGGSPAKPPVFKIPDKIASKPYKRSMDEVYDKILFHGSELRGIREIMGYSSEGMVARVSPAPLPQNWIKDPLRKKWIADPLALDSAFQMAILWGFEEMKKVSLPSYCQSYRQYYSAFPAEGVTAVLEIRETTKHRIICDITFLDKENLVVALLNGYEAVMDDSLLKSFKPKR
ncbi:MAG: SDR family NAD(P)-dependent oxidoreductase [Desulfobacteraceae bacterium]|nr:MAG: SDR family NAD(P)-dependent oxidoreductase [Desulfobacteraceae bacterium]